MCIILFLLQNYRNIKKNFLKLKFYINRIFTPESITLSSVTLHEYYDAKIMKRKASPSVLLHKSEVTYRDTGVSKNDERSKFVLFFYFGWM